MAMEAFTPRSLVAGRLEAVRGRMTDNVAEIACGILGCEQVAVVVSKSAGYFWYLAAPAADLASHPGSRTPLAIALPGHPGHEGDGAYTLDLQGGLQAVVVKRPDGLRSFVGTPPMVKRFIEQEGAALTHACEATGAAWAFPAALAQQRAAKLAYTLTGAGTLVAVLAAAVWLWAAYALPLPSEDSERTALKRQAELDRLLQQIGPGNPPALVNLQKAVEQALRENGALVQFDYQNARATWTIKIGDRVVQGHGQ